MSYLNIQKLCTFCSDRRQQQKKTESEEVLFESTIGNVFFNFKYSFFALVAHSIKKEEKVLCNSQLSTRKVPLVEQQTQLIDYMMVLKKVDLHLLFFFF